MWLNCSYSPRQHTAQPGKNTHHHPAPFPLPSGRRVAYDGLLTRRFPEMCPDQGFIGGEVCYKCGCDANHTHLFARSRRTYANLQIHTSDRSEHPNHHRPSGRRWSERRMARTHKPAQHPAHTTPTHPGTAPSPRCLHAKRATRHANKAPDARPVKVVTKPSYVSRVRY